MTRQVTPRQHRPNELLGEEWKNITIPGLESFQVSDIGRIRYKFNDKVIEPVFDCELDKHIVKLVVNGKDTFVDGFRLAEEMWL